MNRREDVLIIVILHRGLKMECYDKIHKGFSAEKVQEPHIK
jgi:hypothetical protein